MKEWMRERITIYGFIVISGALGLGMYQWICWTKLSAEIWAAWFGAIGTIGTLIGTIIIATNQDRKKSTEAEALAFVTMFSIINSITHIAAGLQSVEIGLKMMISDAKNTSSPDELAAGAAFLIKTIDELPKIDVTELRFLVPLGTQIGLKLAATQGGLQSARFLLIDITKESHVDSVINSCLIAMTSIQQASSTFNSNRAELSAAIDRARAVKYGFSQ